ncbi:unnamed protein product [Orchesella dallaii]|uniref:CCAAT-binding factor domain-containing protein n=1 Tax=Orchesella dallaii TaxID=48710 RepID=A0ABP1Q481_9HEXA
MQDSTQLLPSSTEEDGMESGQDEPVFIKKLKSDISDGVKVGLNPVKQAKFRKAVLYTDIRLDFVDFLKDYLKLMRNGPKDEDKAQKFDETKMKDILALIGIICAKGNFEEDKFYKKNNQQLDALEENYTEFKKHFSELWAEVMKWKMTPSIYRNVVILLPEKVMSHLTKPLHMSDFLLESFKLGGPVSLVSLHGIFLLMQNFNFEVPDFYSRLYSLFTQETLGSKYKARFFAYSREFLSSTHLPEGLVAAFIKRLSRLSTFAPASSLPMIFDFITNLLVQHAGLKVLLNPLKPDGQPKIKDLKLSDYWDTDFDTFKKGIYSDGADVEDPDPFNENEQDPMKSRALESWLCEIKALQNHVVSSIALKAKFINKAVPKVERDLDDTLSLTYKEVEDQEREMSDKLEPTPSHIKPLVEWDLDQTVETKKPKLTNTSV